MEAAVAALRREQVVVTRISPAKAKAEAPVKAGKIGKRASAKSLAVFTRQFSVMIDAGLPLVQCLDILGSQEDDRNFAAVILQTRTDVEGGQSLADAMRKHPKTFDPLFTNMVAAGEAGGILDTILKRLATYIEKAVKLKGQVKSAMIYPVAVIVIVWFVFRHTALGLRMKAVGLSPDAARFAGVNVTRMLLIAALVNGGIAGLAGVNEIAGIHYHMIDAISPGYGYTGIIVAMLGGLNVWGMALAALFIGLIDTGAQTVSRALGVPVYLGDIIQATLLLTTLALLPLQGYRIRRK